MGKFVSIRHHLQEVWDIIRDDGLYLVNLNFLIAIQLLFFGGGLILFYFGNLPWMFTLLIALFCVSFFNISLTGVAKNLFALARERGPGKYPVFHVSYFWLGLPLLLSFLLVSVVPLLIITALIFALLAGTFTAWPYVLIGSVIFYLVWQWLLGLTPAAILDTRANLPDALITSCHLVLKRPWSTLGLLLIDQAILIVASFIPIVGTFAAVNWIALSSDHLYWQLKA